MKLTIRPLGPCTTLTTTTPSRHVAFRRCRAALAVPTLVRDHRGVASQMEDGLFGSPVCVETAPALALPSRQRPLRLGKRWMEYQGHFNWDGLLDPLDDNLRHEILRYGQFVDAAYKAFDFDPSSPTYATCKYPKNSVLERTGLPGTGYRVTKNLRVTSGFRLPRWLHRAPCWVGKQSSWIGYVAVCQDKEEIARLGRRDAVIALRGTATCFEWVENLRATLAHFPDGGEEPNAAGRRTHSLGGGDRDGPMVETGFLSLYTSGTDTCPSLRDMVRGEVARLLEAYGDEPLSLSFTGHSLGSALATLAAHDIKSAFPRSPMVTVFSFGCPRVGNRSFRRLVEDKGTKVLRVVNSEDLVTKVPGFVDDGVSPPARDFRLPGLPSWIRRRVNDTQWVYSEVGRELRFSSKDSPHLSGINVATCHDLATYLHLVNASVSSTGPLMRRSCEDASCFST